MKKTLSQNIFPAICTLTALVVMFFGGIAPTFADGSDGKSCGHHKGKKFEKIDTNADGVLSLEEFKAKAEKRFAKMDADGDGKVTKEEAKKHRAAKREKYRKHREENKAAY